MKKLIVISAPSGAGKTTIVHYLLKKIPELSFSISACSRNKRDNEVNGKDYYFLGIEGFKNKIQENAFIEWEEVYEDHFYGTLKSELERISNEKKAIIFDVDVEGGLNIKKQYQKECLAIFIMPPSVDILRERLSTRGSESEESLQTRIDKALKDKSRHRLNNIEWHFWYLIFQFLLVHFHRTKSEVNTFQFRKESPQPSLISRLDHYLIDRFFEVLYHGSNCKQTLLKQNLKYGRAY